MSEISTRKITAVVVTYNRKDLLRECLKALLAQTRQPDEILVINNASTDGTEELFAAGAEFARPGISLVTLPENVGGAGGFAEGIRRAAGIGESGGNSTEPETGRDISEPCILGPDISVREDKSASASDTENKRDAVWIMDDDTIPGPEALEGLLTAWRHLQTEETNPSFLASTVFGPAGEPMNVPEIDDHRNDNGYSDWYRYLAYGCVRIRQATFVSLLIPEETVRRAGLPLKEYFIWGDDTEYTRRLVRDVGPAFLCGQSRVEHRRANVKKISVFGENDASRIRMYFYYFRNSLYNAAAYEGAGRTAGRFLGYLAMSFTVFFRKNQRHRLQKFLTIQKGCFAFLIHRIPSENSEREE